MGGLSLSHILIIVLVFLIFFRPRKVADLTKSFGKAIRNFKQSYNEIEVDSKDIKDDLTDETHRQKTSTTQTANKNEKV